MLIQTLAQLEWDWSQWMRPVSERWWEETACSMLVGMACGVLGCYVVLRRMALIGDALSHAVLPGVVIAFLVTGSHHVGVLLAGALAAGLLTAVSINIVTRVGRAKEDSAIGIVFTAFFAVGVILVSNMERAVHFDMQCFFWGDPLAVDRPDLLLMLIVAPTVLAVIWLLYHPLKISSFDPVVAAAMGIPVGFLHYLLMGMLSATVVAGLKTTGVILVVAMIITPASAAYQLTNRLSVMLVLGGLFGALSALGGMSLAFVANAPSGPAMVVSATAIFGLAVLLSPKHGFVFRWIRNLRLRRHIDGEDVLKAVFRLSGDDAAPSLPAVAQKAQLPEPRVGALLAGLRRQGLIGEGLSLTEDGKRRALEMVRAHRLWESYLAEEANVDADAVHDQAEQLEHAHELADAVDQMLGHPRLDPHGEEIPRLESEPPTDKPTG